MHYIMVGMRPDATITCAAFPYNHPMDINLEQIVISPFETDDQEEVRNLILCGLVEHWGILDPSKNPDLIDIATSYADAFFLVARYGDRIVGTGALIPRSGDSGEIVRMSVAADFRRIGLGKKLLLQLIDQAKKTGMKKIILETTETWLEVIRFYEEMGFEITHYTNGDVYFQMLLTSDGAQIHS